MTKMTDSQYLDAEKMTLSHIFVYMHKQCVLSKADDWSFLGY